MEAGHIPRHRPVRPAGTADPSCCRCPMSCSFAAGNSPRPFMQTLAAAIASAGRRLTSPAAHAPERWHHNVVSPLSQPGVPTRVLTF